MPLWKGVAAPEGYELQGPKMFLEFFESLRSAGTTISQYDKDWALKSGVPPRGVVARMHSCLAEALRFLMTVDQLDPTELVCAEYLCRQIVLLETAVDKNPKNPDWEGLDVTVSARITARGKAEVVNFQEWLSKLQMAQAQT